MSGLEKVLEEIEAERADIDDSSSAKDRMLDRHWNNCLDAVADIIKKHMNDDWIPVEDRLPEEGAGDGELIITDKDGRIWSGIYYGITEEIDEEPCFHKWDEEMWHCYKPDVIAWRPLPEPYCPERSDSHVRE